MNSGLHPESQSSQEKQEFDLEEVYAKYETIDKVLRQMHTYIMIRHLKTGKLNEEINNDQNNFLKMHRDSPEGFKMSTRYLLLLLEYEHIVSESIKPS